MKISFSKLVNAIINDLCCNFPDKKQEVYLDIVLSIILN